MKLLRIALFFSIVTSAAAQQKTVDAITKTVTTTEVQTHLTFLASDALKGRDTGSPEIEIAAQYIASYFSKIGLKPGGTNGYFQPVQLVSTVPPSAIEFTVNDKTFLLKDDLIQFGGASADLEAPVVFVGYGSQDDLEKANVKGKIVVALLGSPDENNLSKTFLEYSPAKAARVMKMGAVALVEIVMNQSMPFPAIVNYLNRTRMSLKSGDSTMPHLWMRNADEPALKQLLENKSAEGKLHLTATPPKLISAKNVLGIIEGTDRELKNEYIVVSAHYDHVGIGRKDANQDSIYNGARDNAIGTVGMMETAKYLVKYRPKRSVLFIAFTAEEKGLLGSAWYAAHPTLPLDQIVFNFNCDGAGYNDTSITTVIGLHRTSVEPLLAQANEAFDLKVTDDPVPEQNLFDRSDNYNFAVKGIPAIDYSPGIKEFNQELMKYYHQPADEVGTLDMNYLIKFFRSFVYANDLIANMSETPFWTAGDKYEAAGKALYSH